MSPEPATERGWLERHSVEPKKRWGQNFLLDPSLAGEIVRRAAWPADATVIEIGPGGGALTAALLGSGRKVLGIEIDRGLLEVLRSRFPEELDSGRLVLREGDFLRLPWDEIAAALGTHSAASPPSSPPSLPPSSPPPSRPSSLPYLAGNIPYGITTACLTRALAWRDRLAGAVFMVQREYADRLLARPGSKTYGSLTVWASARSSLRLLLRVGRSSFWPRPGVESAVVELAFPDPPPFPGDPAMLERVLRAAFGQRRKTLENALAHGLGLAKPDAAGILRRAGCDPQWRAEVVALEQYARIVAEVAAHDGA